MDYFNSYAPDPAFNSISLPQGANNLRQPNSMQRANPAAQGPRSFREDFGGLLQGLNSTIQLSFTGVSMLQFFFTLKSVLKSIRKYLKPKMVNLISAINPKNLLRWLLSLLEKVFKIRSMKEGIFKFCLAASVFVAAKFLSWFFGKKKMILEEKRKQESDSAGIDKTSAEFSNIRSMWEGQEGMGL